MRYPIPTHRYQNFGYSPTHTHSSVGCQMVIKWVLIFTGSTQIWVDFRENLDIYPPNTHFGPLFGVFLDTNNTQQSSSMGSGYLPITHPLSGSRWEDTHTHPPTRIFPWVASPGHQRPTALQAGRVACCMRLQ